MSEAINSQSALPIGGSLLHYRLSGELGRGGFSFTYKALDTKLNRAVVIKEYLPLDLAGRRGDYTIAPHTAGQAENFQSGLASFLKEAQTLAQFHQPNIVPVLDYFQGNGTAYLVMPYLEGQTLADTLARRPDGRMSEAEVMAWLNPVLEALQIIHAAGYLHRDLKPDNIFLQASGNPMLIDFGAARNALANRSRSLSVVLTPGYAPAEQYSSAAANQGPWTDLYALGAVIFRCLTGAEPLDSTERQDTVANGEPDPFVPQLRNLTGLASPRLAQAVEGCLRVARKDRPQGVAELRRILDGQPAPKYESVPSVRPEAAADILPEPRPKKMALRLALAAGALLAIALAFYAYNRRPSAPELAPAPPPPAASAPATAIPAAPALKDETREEPAAPQAADSATAPEVPASLPTYVNSIGQEFALIPAGSFLMGSPPDDELAFDWEKPAHQATISRPFYLGKYEVTRAQWEAVMGNNSSWCSSNEGRGRDNPVDCVSWEEAHAFIQKLNQKEKTNKYRLPTEAEWEYAERAGRQTRYHFGESGGNMGEYAWYGDNSGGKTHPVGQKKPNAWGLFDMAGNAGEWVEDWYGGDYYRRSPGLDPPGPATGEYRVVRGICLDDPAEDCRSASRGDEELDSHVSFLGFRLALSLDDAKIAPPSPAQTKRIEATFPNGDKYEGESKDGQPHGRGVLIYADGGRYEGEFKDGQRTGRAVYTFHDGARYEGEYKDGQRNGRGVLTYANGNRYEGEFKDGQPHGRGVLTFADGKRYEGEFKDGQRTGRTVVTLPDGTRYEGEYKDGMASGRGVVTLPNGDRYEGEFKDGEPNGRGVYTYADGRREAGEYKNGARVTKK